MNRMKKIFNMLRINVGMLQFGGCLRTLDSN